MYADTEPFFPYFEDFSHEVQQLGVEELFHPHQSSPPSMIDQSSFISEYDVGGGGDLFKAPADPIFEEPFTTTLDPVLDPMAAAVSMISLDDQDLKVGNFESLQVDELFDRVSYECKNDIVVANELMDAGIPVLASDDIQTEGSLSCAMFPISTSTIAPSLLDYSDQLDFGAAYYEMRRSFSNGDIKLWQWAGINDCCSSKDRQQQLSRYRIKKSKRNFGRKVKEGSGRQPAKDPRKVRQDQRHLSVEQLKILQRLKQAGLDRNS